MNLDDLDRMRALDPQNFLGDVDALPDQLELAWKLAQTHARLEHVSDSWHAVGQVIVAGMGGSAGGAELVQGYVAGACRVPLTLLRDYSLPAWAGPETVVIAISHSGNTEETLAASQAALERGVRLVAITRGGQLSIAVHNAGQPLWGFQHGGRPRAAVGFVFMLTLGVLVKLGLVPDPSAEVAGAVAALRAQQPQLRAETPVTANPAKRLAGQLMERVPLICGAGYLAPVARRWKRQINEVAKALAVCDELPEMDHNSVAGTLYPERLVGKFMALFLRSSLEHPRHARRADLTRELYMTAGFNTDVVNAAGPSPLAHLFTSLHFGDYTAFYLANCYGVDPSPVPQIDYLKEQLSQSSAAA
jgi:glucose/mannose-6-phosphate isomerase